MDSLKKRISDSIQLRLLEFVYALIFGTPIALAITVVFAVLQLAVGISLSMWLVLREAVALWLGMAILWTAFDMGVD